MKKLVFTSIILLLSCCGIYGQISTQEEPISFSRRDISALSVNERTVKSFAALDMEKIEQEDREDEASGIPPRFGYKHKVDYNLDNSGEWITLPNGDRIWRLTISCSGALSINLLYDKFWLPEGAKFWIYSNDHKHSIGAFTSANNMGDRSVIQGFATGLVYGSQVTLEYYLPSEIKEVGIISIAYVVHGYRYIVIPESMQGRGYGQSDWCQVNVNCPEGQNWQREKNAIAMILVNGFRYCSGSLINTTANDLRPLFLTADHCLGGWAQSIKYDAVTHNSPNLTHWSFYWHYESPTCANIVPTIRSTVGAKLIANNSISDFALLDLNGANSDPRNRSDVIPYYLGWDRSGSAGTGGVGIHHPSGDIKKISTYTMTPQSTANESNFVNANATHWRVVWAQTSASPLRHGVTEGGSSGSPLINSNRRVIGQLHSGTSYCDPTVIDGTTYNRNSPDWYGKFSVSWTGSTTNTPAADNRRRLNHWLAPGMSNPPQILNGIGIADYSITGLTYFCSSGTYSITPALPAGWSVEWTVKRTRDAWNGVTVITQTFSTPTITLYGDSNSYSEFLEISATVRASNGVSVAAPTYRAVNGPPSPHTGSLILSYIAQGSSQNVGVNSWSQPILHLNPGTTRLYIQNFRDLAGNNHTNTQFIYAYADFDHCGSMSFDYPFLEVHLSDDMFCSGSLIGYIDARLDNSCGFAHANSIFRFYIQISSYLSTGVEVSLNPETDILNIEIDLEEFAKIRTLSQETNDSENATTTCNIRLYDILGNILRETTTKENKVAFDVSDLPEGNYFLHIYDGISDKPVIQKMIIKNDI
jgi:hypothetical protein